VKNEAALLYAQSAIADKWETEERGSYDVETLHQEYRERLFSAKAVALMNERPKPLEE
jgi:hypothetical protein